MFKMLALLQGRRHASTCQSGPVTIDEHTRQLQRGVAGDDKRQSRWGQQQQCTKALHRDEGYRDPGADRPGLRDNDSVAGVGGTNQGYYTIMAIMISHWA